EGRGRHARPGRGLSPTPGTDPRPAPGGPFLLNFRTRIPSFYGMKRLIALLLATIAVLAGCATLDERQRTWIFQPSDRSWWRVEEAAAGMEEIWIDFVSAETGQSTRLHGLWSPHDDFHRRP